MFLNNNKLFKEHWEKEYGVFFFENTGDDLIDKWEQEIAQGLVPDLTEGLPKDFSAEKLKKDKENIGADGTILSKEVIDHLYTPQSSPSKAFRSLQDLIKKK